MKSPSQRQSKFLKTGIWLFAAGWTALILALLLVNHFDTQREVESVALHEARVAFQRDLAYRIWNAESGGVYVPVTGKTSPNPYLADLPERDITTTDGRKLTLINPAYMTRIVHELAFKEFGLRSHITSRKPIRPENAPDAWEAAALEKIESGQAEVSETVPVEGQPHLRLMGRLVTEARCVKCHEKQGYREGEVRGGISIAVPLESPGMATLLKNRRKLSAGLAGVWVVGLIGMAASGRALREQLRERGQVEDRLRFQALLLDQISDTITATDLKGRIVFVNAAQCRASGRTAQELVGTLVESYGDDPQRGATQRQIIEETLRQGTWQGDVVNRDGEGRERLVHCRTTVVNDDAGRPIGMCGVGTDITERKRWEETLRESEARYRLLAEAGHDVIWLMNLATGRFEYVSPSVQKLRGYTVEEVLGQSMAEALTAESYRAVSEGLPLRLLAFASGDQSARVQTHEVSQPCKDGSTVPTEVMTTLIADEQGRVTHIRGVTRDISERRRTEELLRESRTRLDLALQSARLGVWSWDMVENKRRFDPVVCQILGIDPAAFGGTAAEFFSATHPEDHERIRAAMRRTIESDALYEPEYRAVWPDGSIHHIHVRGKLLRDEKGRPQRLNGVLWDNTERVQAEQALRRSEADLALAQAVGHVGSWISTPPEQGTLTWSEESHRIFGVPKDQFDGRVETFFQHVHPDDRGLLAEATRAAWRGDGPYDLEHRIVRPDGNVRWVHEQATVEKDAAGQPVRMIGVVQDITERKEAEVERERLNRELGQRNRELQSVLYAASHDLRSPLLNIQGFRLRLDQACGELTRLLTSGGEPGDTPALRMVRDRIPQALGFIRASAEKMDMLINGMLRLSRLGQIMLRPERLDLNRILEQTIAALAIQVQAAGATVVVDPLPACVGDSSLISQVFTNLVENALKYRDPVRPLRIHVTGRVEGVKVLICVADNGSGIAPENLERIWELFARVNRSGEPGEGLGLNLVRRILDRHEGRVWVESTLGEGSRFYVEWPGCG